MGACWSWALHMGHWWNASLSVGKEDYKDLIKHWVDMGKHSGYVKSTTNGGKNDFHSVYGSVQKHRAADDEARGVVCGCAGRMGLASAHDGRWKASYGVEDLGNGRLTSLRQSAMVGEGLSIMIRIEGGTNENHFHQEGECPCRS